MKARKFTKGSFFKKLDIFGNLFNFTVNREEKFKTNLGAIFSIFTFLVIVVTCILFGKDFYNRTNPKVLSQKTVPEKYSQINLTNKKLTFSWRIEDENGFEVLDFKGILYPALIYTNMALNPVSKSMDFAEPMKNIQIKRCNETQNEKDFDHFRNPDMWYCADFDSDLLNFGGYWDGDFVSYFMFNLNVCNRDHTGERTSECGKFEDLKRLLDRRIFLTVNLPSVFFDFTDYQDPMKIEYKTYDSHITRNLLRSDYCFFNFPVIKDDRGWIFSDYNEETYMSYDYCERNYFLKFDEDYFNEASDDIVYGMDLYLGKSFPFYIRTFMKFQDLAAIVGGFVKIITLIFGFVNYYFSAYERDNFIMNYFFNLLDKNENETIKNNKNETLREMKNEESKLEKKSYSFDNHEHSKQNKRFSPSKPAHFSYNDNNIGTNNERMKNNNSNDCSSNGNLSRKNLKWESKDSDNNNVNDRSLYIMNNKSINKKNIYKNIKNTTIKNKNSPKVFSKNNINSIDIDNNNIKNINSIYIDKNNNNQEEKNDSNLFYNSKINNSNSNILLKRFNNNIELNHNKNTLIKLKMINNENQKNESSIVNDNEQKEKEKDKLCDDSINENDKNKNRDNEIKATVINYKKKNDKNEVLQQENEQSGKRDGKINLKAWFIFSFNI